MDQVYDKAVSKISDRLIHEYVSDKKRFDSAKIHVLADVNLNMLSQTTLYEFKFCEYLLKYYGVIFNDFLSRDDLDGSELDLIALRRYLRLTKESIYNSKDISHFNLIQILSLEYLIDKVDKMIYDFVKVEKSEPPASV